jgi:hypothetical protein
VAPLWALLVNQWLGMRLGAKYRAWMALA